MIKRVGSNRSKFLVTEKIGKKRFWPRTLAKICKLQDRCRRVGSHEAVLESSLRLKGAGIVHILDAIFTGDSPTIPSISLILDHRPISIIFIPLPFPERFLTVSFPRRGGSVVGDSDWTLENTKVKIEGVKHISSLPPPSADKPQNIYRTIFKPRKVEIRRRRAAQGVAQPHETHNDSVISLRPEEKETEKDRAQGKISSVC